MNPSKWANLQSYTQVVQPVKDTGLNVYFRTQENEGACLFKWSTRGLDWQGLEVMGSFRYSQLNLFEWDSQSLWTQQQYFQNHRWYLFFPVDSVFEQIFLSSKTGFLLNRKLSLFSVKFSFDLLK